MELSYFCYSSQFNLSFDSYIASTAASFLFLTIPFTQINFHISDNFSCDFLWLSYNPYELNAFRFLLPNILVSHRKLNTVETLTFG